MGEDQVNESVKDGGLRFIRVEAADREGIDIDLSNGTFVMLRPKLILELPGFAGLAEDDRIFYPKTGGNTIYWQAVAEADRNRRISRADRKNRR